MIGLIMHEGRDVLLFKAPHGLISGEGRKVR